jgi:uncharacterized repeat protein (TIGR01451 family)
MGIDRTRGRARRASVSALVVGLAFIGVGLGGIETAAADQAISTLGPLTSVVIGTDLNCAVNHVGDSAGEFYNDTACATEISVAGGIYGPEFIPAGNDPGGFIPVSQSAVTGSGTVADPFQIVTVVDVSTTGLRITETDSYVTGQESYRTDVKVANTTASAISAVLYRGGDCFLQNLDTGFGSVGNPAGAVACLAADTNDPTVPGTRVEQWLPLTSGSHYLESEYSSVWDAMSSGQDFPDTCDCATNEDNGAGLSWAITVPASGSVTESHLTTFSPLGSVPLSMTKTADQATVDAGAQDGYTITVENPNNTTVDLATLTDSLPPGFSYVAGSTTGATTADPTVASQTLTWNGPLTVPAATGGTSGSLSLHFTVTVSGVPGTYLNAAAATATSFTILPTGNTAPILVNPTSTTSSSSSTSSTTESTTSTTESTTSTTASTTSTTESTTTTTMEPTSTSSASSTSTIQPTTTTVAADCKPGNGWGDRNHCHSGPPGQSDQRGGGDRFRLIGFTTSSGTRWLFIADGVALILMALVLQRRVRRLL